MVGAALYFSLFNTSAIYSDGTAIQFEDELGRAQKINSGLQGETIGREQDWQESNHIDRGTNLSFALILLP